LLRDESIYSAISVVKFWNFFLGEMIEEVLEFKYFQV